MADDIDYATHTVSGLTAHCYSHISARGSTRPVVICFLMHMRMGSYKQVEFVAHALVNQVHGRCNYDFYVVSFVRYHFMRITYVADWAVDCRITEIMERG